MIDGTGGACFAASGCFAAAVPAVVVDPGDCTYALPNTASAPALAPGAPANPILGCPPDEPGQPHIPCDGINVEITYDGGYTREILDKENDEGFSVPDPAKPQRFRLAPGLCDLVKGETQDGTPTAHRITAVRATGLCRAKGPFQPLCANDQLGAMGTPLGVSGTPKTPDACKPQELKPAQSVLTILADDTENNAIFYKGSGGGTGSGALANSGLVTKALEDPAFENTLIGLTLFPGRAGASCGPHDPEFTPALKKVSQPAIAAKFVLLAAKAALEPQDTDLKLSSALDDAYKALQGSYPTANKRAVLVISNRGFDTNSCSAALGLPAARALAAHNSNTAMEPPVDTYVALLARDLSVTDSDPPPVVPDAQAVAEAGAPPGSGAHVFDGRKDKNQAIDALRKIVDELATCAYGSTEKPVADPGATSVLTYSDPVAIPGPQPTFHTIPHDAACTGNGAAGNGWGYDSVKKRVYVCGAACQTYRDTLRTAAAYAAQYSQPSLPVPMFAHKAECAPK